MTDHRSSKLAVVQAHIFVYQVTRISPESIVHKTSWTKNSVVSVKIVGDVQTYPLPENSFDLIVCWDVLEHLEFPQAALERVFDATKPGGSVTQAAISAGVQGLSRMNFM